MISKTELIKEFSKVLEAKIDAYTKTQYPETWLAGRSDKVTIKPGKKYTKIDVGRSGKFMFDNADCHLYFIKGYGVINRKKDFGSLLLIIQKGFDWDGYSILPFGMSKNHRSVYGYAGKIA